MNHKFRLHFVFLFLFALLALTACSSVSIPLNADGLVIGQSYRLNSGETLNEDLTVIGGNANLEQGSTLNGNLAVIGGNVNVDGTVTGDLSVMGGSVYLDDHATIEGRVQSLGGTVQQSELAVVEGKDLGGSGFQGRIDTLRVPGVNVSFEPVVSFFVAIFQALALAALAVVINLFAPRPMERVSQTAMQQAPASGGVGCLTLLVLVVMAITIILIPVSLLGTLAAGVMIMLGWASLGLVLGRRMAQWLNQTWTDPLSAGIGTLSLSLLASLIGAIPCVGWTVPFAVGMIALGAVVLTRFGTQLYPPAYAEIYPAPQPPVSNPPASHDFKAGDPPQQ